MQDIRLEMKLHDILDGDEPPKDGYYLIVDQKMAMVSVVIEQMWWDSKHHGWKSDEESPIILMPAEYFGRKWTDDFLTSLLDKGVLA